MKYEFVHHRNNDWNFEEEAIINKTIDLVKNLNQDQVLEKLAQHLFEITRVKYVLLGKPQLPDPTELRTLILLENGKVLDNMNYSIVGAPCENVLSYSICYYPLGIQNEFPQALLLQHLGVHSYMGITLKDSTNQNIIGIITLLHDKTIENPGFIEHILTIIAPALEEYILTAPV